MRAARRPGRQPTAVTDDDPSATDADRRAVAAAAGTSHAAFLGLGRTPDGGLPVRFFTATAELSGCGHGTVAAQAVRLTRAALGELNDRQHTGGRTFDTVAIRRPAGIEVWFGQGLVALRHPAPDERAAIVAALGLTADDPHPTDAPRIAARGPRDRCGAASALAICRPVTYCGGVRKPRTQMREPTYFVLASLLDGPLHGYAIIRRTEELSGGRVRLATGTLYTALDRLTADGYVELVREEIVNGRARRSYGLTSSGAGALRAEATRMAEAARLVTDEGRRLKAYGSARKATA